MANPKNAAWYGGGLVPWLLPAASRIFYVNSAARAALDTNTGLDPDNAFLTIDVAIAACSGITHDYIFVIEHDDATETYPIEMDVARVHLIGEPCTGRPLPRIRVDSDVDAIDLSADYCEIAGLAIDSDQDGYTNRLIDVSGGNFNIHHNYIAWFFWGYDCVHCRGGSANNGLIADNYFGAHGYANYAVYTDASPSRVVVRDNVIVNNGAQKNGITGIYLASDAYCSALDNKLKVAGGADGQAIHLVGTANFATGNEVCGPQGGFGAFNPFRSNVLTSNFWGVNYAGATPLLPVVS